MNGLRRTPKRIRLHELDPHWRSLQGHEKTVDDADLSRTKKLSKDPVKFFEQIVGFKPTSYQAEFIKMFVENQFIAARWCRQSGKSWIISALLLWYALNNPDSYIAVVGPSWRQTKLIIRRISYFLRKVPPAFYSRPLKTIIRFNNGSCIEAFPNNPDTIRGPTLQIVYCDEMNFIRDDEELYDACLFTLGTVKDGKFVCSSTPWNTDSIFYKIFNNNDFEDFAKSHITWREAEEPNGPLRKNILDKIRKQFAEDPWRWKREMEADWAEDENVWLSQSLITKCIGTERSCGDNLDLINTEMGQRGRFYGGLDFGKHGDYTALSVIDSVGDKFFLRYLKIWPLETPYASVIGFVKQLTDRWQTFTTIRADQTGIGDYIVEDMKDGGIQSVEGVTFSLPRKQEMASLLKQRMMDGKFFYPYFTWDKPYRSEYVAELNVERFALKKDGTVILNHPQGTHDDVFWSTALALYATVEMKPVELGAFRFI